ncbi:7726c439-1785-487a-a824-86724c783bc7 [Sclerotinia trifoliorum]|uniref:7726c439-1785-487a-a824-86724c783bc7 n=1 Tax=Sclerotinia trifoliorum TaxID=28548 RepID=A0A8H2VQV5_9HELO|nr:7726c439-1785-487a-a824-86724c783bc7 [Sclerotinia trifoliorum]
MDITLAPHFWEQLPTPVISGMWSFLSPAVNLEKLRVALDSVYFFIDTFSIMTWDSIVGLLKLPKLKSFELYNISGTYEHLPKFFKDHISTLQHLYLGDLILEGNMSGWDNVFTTLQSVPLRTCQLRGYLGGKY